MSRKWSYCSDDCWTIERPLAIEFAATTFPDCKATDSQTHERSTSGEL